jgi:hypothetical protein
MWSICHGFVAEDHARMAEIWSRAKMRRASVRARLQEPRRAGKIVVELVDQRRPVHHFSRSLRLVGHRARKKSATHHARSNGMDVMGR